MLLDEITGMLADNKGDLAEALEKAQAFLRQTGRGHKVPSWFMHEMQGYPDSHVPSYRVVSSRIHGQITSIASIACPLADYVVPIQDVRAISDGQVIHSPATSSLKSLEERLERYRRTGEVMMCQVCGDAQRQIQKDLKLAGLSVVSVWCEVDMADIENILVHVRSRLLQFLQGIDDDAR